MFITHRIATAYLLAFFALFADLLFANGTSGSKLIQLSYETPLAKHKHPQYRAPLSTQRFEQLHARALRLHDGMAFHLADHTHVQLLLSYLLAVDSPDPLAQKLLTHIREAVSEKAVAENHAIRDRWHRYHIDDNLHPSKWRRFTPTLASTRKHLYQKFNQTHRDAYRAILTQQSIRDYNQQVGGLDFDLFSSLQHNSSIQHKLLPSNNHNSDLALGLSVKSEDGMVSAYYSGRVILSEYIPGYGHTVILQHTHASHTSYGRLSLPLVNQGDYLHKGMRLGVKKGTYHFAAW